MKDLQLVHHIMINQIYRKISNIRRCSNYIWVINNFVAHWGAAYISGLMVCVPHFVYLQVEMLKQNLEQRKVRVTACGLITVTRSLLLTVRYPPPIKEFLLKEFFVDYNF